MGGRKKMNNKTICILVMTLLIATTIPAIGDINAIIVSNKFPATIQEVKDQYQEFWGIEENLLEFNPSKNWQQFVPTMANHVRVEVHAGEWCQMSYPITLTIERPLGTVYTSKTLLYSDFPYNQNGWVSFDIPDVTLTPGNQYYLVLTFDCGSEYAWSGATGNPYMKGASSEGGTFDYCFRTFCVESGHPSMEVEKEVWDGDSWVDQVYAAVCTNVRFRITIHNNGDYDLTDIVVTDTLPHCLEYADNATPFEPQVVGNKLTWHFPGPLQYCNTITIEFNAHVIEEGENINNVDVGADSDGGSIDGGDTATVIGTEEPEPDLSCDGDLSFANVVPGSTVTDTIYVLNIGSPGSKLKWKVCGNPTWGTWTFSPSSGTDLTPAMGLKPITVTVVAPNEKNKVFTGEINLCNEEDSADTCTLGVSLATPKNKPYINTPFLNFLEKQPHLFLMLRQILGLQ